MTWPRPGALPSPKESTMTWWICQSPKKLDIVIYLQAPEPPLSFFAGPVQPCYHIRSVPSNVAPPSHKGKNCLGIWPPLATTCPDLYSHFCAVAVGRGPQSMSCSVPYLAPLNHEVSGWEVALSWENLGDVFIICVPSMFEGGGLCLCDVNI